MKTRNAWSYLFSRNGHSTQIFHKSALVTAFFAVSISSFAAPLTGGFNISGSVTVSLNTIDWSSNGGTTGTFVTNSPATGSFVGINGLNPPFYTGTVKDLFAPPVPVTRFLDAFTAPGFGNLFFDLSSIIAPVAPACTGANLAVNVDCSLGSFTLRNTVGGGVGIDLALTGFFQNGADTTTRTAGKGLYTTQLTDPLYDNVQKVYNTITTNGSISSAYSANYTTASAVPEPGTSVLIALGTFFLLAGRLRSRKQGVDSE